MSGAEGKRELVCIACPLACRLAVAEGRDGAVSVSGNRCERGEQYGREEVLAPRRVVTAVVPTTSAAFPCAPVRTDRPVARGDVKELLRALYAARVDLPVRCGAIFIEDFHGARVMFTRTLPPDDVPPVGEPGAEAESQ